MNEKSLRCTFIGNAQGPNEPFNGRCKIIWDDGDVFEGKISNSQLIIGEFSWADGDFYRGEFNPETTLMHGKGEYHYCDGRIFRGMFCNGMKHGYGQLTDSNNNSSYCGNFDADQRCGYGEQNFSDGRKFLGKLAYIYLYSIRFQSFGNWFVYQVLLSTKFKFR